MIFNVLLILRKWYLILNEPNLLQYSKNKTNQTLLSYVSMIFLPSQIKLTVEKFYCIGRQNIEIFPLSKVCVFMAFSYPVKGLEETVTFRVDGKSK